MSHVPHVLIYTAWCLLLPVVLGAALWRWGEDGPRNDEPPDTSGNDDNPRLPLLACSA